MNGTVSPGLAAARAIAAKHLKLFLRTPMEVTSTLLAPVLWLLLFGVALQHVIGGQLTGTTTNYLGFLAPGLVALTALTASLFGGATFYLEIDRGQARQYLTAPMARLEYLLGLGVAASLKTMAQSAIVLALAIPLGLAGFAWTGAGLALFLVGAFALGAFGLSAWLAVQSPSFEAFHGILILTNLPLLFLSDAIYPLNSVPDWFATIAAWNPLTHLVEALRWLIVAEPSPLGLDLNLAVLAVFALIGVLLGTRAVHQLAK